MHIIKRSTIVVLAVLLTVLGCSRKKSTFVTRSWHAVGTEYNILFNGYNALDQGVENLRASFTDNYWDVLPVERMEVKDEVVLPGESQNSDFQTAEEKAVKAIQKHSMNIKGKENNPQMDEAYLLLGKARYYDQRFVPALEAFNYILYKYPSSDKINQARIWREKANIRLENNELAITNLERLMYQEELKGQDLADATSSLAQAYLNTGVLDTAIVMLRTAANATKINDEKGRFRFIEGQIYDALGKPDSANMAYDQVIALNRKIPRIYLMNAYLSKAKNINVQGGNALELLETLTELEEDRENRPYLDKIYYTIGDYYREHGPDSMAEVYYNKSLRTNSVDNYLNALSYQHMGDMNFDRVSYRRAGAYYDSTMQQLNERSREYRAIKKKRDNLDEVIYFENVAQVNDSLLRLIRMPEDERLAYFEAFTENLKAEAEERERIKALAERKTGVATAASTLDIGGATGGNTSFYFYNPTTVAFGKNNFIQVWGERQLADNWRWSANIGGGLGAEDPLSDVIADASDEQRYDPQYYIDLLPAEPTQVDSLQRDRNFAYYQLGLIYKDKFNIYPLAKDKLTELLRSEPEERLVLPAKYNLYKIYLELGQAGEADVMKNDILSNHPESRYAAILLNPETDLGEDENDPEVIYKDLYTRYENQEYAEVIALCETYINRFDGEVIVPKFEFLKAVARGRIYGFESYKEALNFIALNYPNSEEGRQAAQLVESTIPLLENKEFSSDDDGTHFKAFYVFKDESEEAIDAFYEALEKAVGALRYFDLTLSKDIYDKNTTFVVVHGFRNVNGALGFSDILKDSKQEIDRPHIAISSQNYQIVQIHKNLDAYLKFE